MDQVIADRMQPVHGTPADIVRIVLGEKMVLSFVINQAVRIVDPALAGREMVNRTDIWFDCCH